MGQKISTKIQEVQRVSYMINSKRNKPRNIFIKLTKTEYREKVSKAAKEK